MQSRRSRRSWWRIPTLLITMLVIGAMMGLLGSGLLLPLTAAAGNAVIAGASYFNTLPGSLSDPRLEQTSVMLTANGRRMATFYDQDRTVVPLAAMSPLVRGALVAVEDSRFYQHGAVDPRGLVRAVVNNVTGGSTEGASTITQQYVKNVLLQEAVAAGDVAGEQAATARTTSRKIQELRYAVTVEQQLTKNEILQRYLNIVYFGRQSYGVQAAAERFFGVSASRLSLPQAALLAGLVQDPSAYDPIAHPLAASVRRNTVLADMHTQGMISTASYRRAVATRVVTRRDVPPGGCAAAGAEGFFCEYVIRSLITSPVYRALGATPAAREHTLLTGGLVIRTTLDPASQLGAVQAVNRAIPPTDPSGLATTAVTVQPGTGYVVSMAEDRTYSVTAGRGRTSINYAVDSDLGGASGFQTGSSFKPFTLATWLAGGGRLSDTVDATKRAFPFSDFTACGNDLRGSQPYAPGNSEGNEGGRMSVQTATSNSVNVAYVAMETKLDLCDIANTAQSLGVHLAAPQQICSATGPATENVPTCLPSLTLGVLDIAPLTMAAAYAGFATGGTWCAPMPVLAINRLPTDTRPSTGVAAYHPACKQALDPGVASQVNDALRHVLTDGTAAAVGPLNPWDSAGKTGTTDGPHDTWFVGYTAQRSTAVWVADPGTVVHGVNERQQLTDITVNGTSYGTIFGASIAAPIWKSVMNVEMSRLPAVSLP